MRKKKELNMSLGKIENDKPTTIDQVLGDCGSGRYTYLRDPFDENEYRNYLESMLPGDLYRHAQGFGLSFADNKGLLVVKLIDIFKRDRAQYNKLKVISKAETGERKKLPKDLQDFLAGAR